MSAELHRDAESIAYITARSGRYAGAVDIDASWTREALTDVDLVAMEPDPSPGWAHPGSSVTHSRRDSCWS